MGQTMGQTMRRYEDERTCGEPLSPEDFIAKMRMEFKRFSFLGWDRCADAALRALEEAQRQYTAAMVAEQRQEMAAERRMEEALYRYEM